MEKIDKLVIKRMNEIEEEAINRFLEKADFDLTEWMTDEELAEYKELFLVYWGEDAYKTRFGEE
jgi:succinate dehydrogenase flavin-adding protein (antitoxin of CptAB toxin-antitoxin module)